MTRSHRRMIATVTALVLFASVPSSAGADEKPQVDPAKLAEIPKRLQPFIDKQEIAGAVTLVVTRDGGVVHHEALGLADIEKKKAMTKDALFWIASMTKPITGVALLILQDEGKLSFDDPVGRHIPELAELKTADGKPAKTITLRHLATHTAGMAENTGEETRAAKNLAELVAGFAKRPVQFEAGAKWQYSQSGINAMGRVVEVVGGKPFEQFVEERIFKPLGMTDTTFYPTKEQVARLATSYRLEGGSLLPAEIFIFAGRDLSERDRTPLPNGGLFSTAADYGRFCQMLLRGGELDGKRILKPDSVKELGALHSGKLGTGFTPGNGWGLGVCVVRQPQGVSAALSPGSFGHGGAYGTQAWIDPVKGVAYVLMVQRANFPNADNSDVRKAFQDTAAGALAGK